MWIVLALSIRSVFWLHWLEHAVLHGIRAKRSWVQDPASAILNKDIAAHFRSMFRPEKATREGECWSISVLPSLFHQIGLLVALARAYSSTWYQSPGSRVQVLVFAIYCKIVVAPLCVHVLTFSSPITREWGCWSVYVDCTSPFHHFGLLVALASAWSLTLVRYLYNH
jgi:hypothetical protein